MNNKLYNGIHMNFHSFELQVHVQFRGGAIIDSQFSFTVLRSVLRYWNSAKYQTYYLPDTRWVEGWGLTPRPSAHSAGISHTTGVHVRDVWWSYRTPGVLRSEWCLGKISGKHKSCVKSGVAYCNYLFTVYIQKIRVNNSVHMKC